uniref:Uncharacterized protein n=1 Tax=Pararge aegeria TaxID=116150 RepID=S4P1E9_9NEOP
MQNEWPIKKCSYFLSFIKSFDCDYTLFNQKIFTDHPLKLLPMNLTVLTAYYLQRRHFYFLLLCLLRFF